MLSTTGPVAKTYTYDAAGNVIDDGLHTYGYDDRGRLVDVDSGSVTYEYNGQGQRVKKDDGTDVTLYAYNEDGQLIGEYTGTGSPIAEHFYFDGIPVAVRQGTTIYYVHSDHLGTPRAVTSGNTVIWRWESDAFGATAAQDDPDADLTTFTYNLRFPGQYYDSETGLHYNYFRTLDPSTGRYLESDPIGLNGGPNTYGYVGGNPLSWIDPFGLDTLVISNGQNYTHGGGNPAGHSAIAVTGSGIHSSGNNTAPGSSVADYLNRELASRDTTLTVIKTTPDQEKAILDYLKSLAPMKDEFTNPLEDSCAIRSSDSLAAAGLPLVRWNPRGGGAITSSAILPLAVQEQAEYWRDRLGGQSIKVPINSDLSGVLPALQQFEPK